MLTTIVLSLAGLIAAAPAPSGHGFQAPKAGDGFLPRNGKALSLPILIKGLRQGMNVGIDFTTAIGGLGLQSSPDPLSTTFDLNNLDEHNFPIEHDGSLSRLDFYEGDDHSFNQGVFNEVLGFYANNTTATFPVASKARYARIQSARAVNPTFIYGIRQLLLSYGETALYLSVLGDPITGEAPMSYVKSLFEHERLPYKEGWKKPKVATTLTTLGLMISKLQAANPDAAAEGPSLGEGTYRDVLDLINPLTGKVENATCIITGQC